jgi:hypothetical protein
MKHPREKYRWTQRERARLFMAWRDVPLAKLVREFGRSRGAIIVEARILGLEFGVPRGCVSIREACRRSGFHRRVLMEEFAAARVRLHPIENVEPVKHPRFYVSEEDLDRVLAIRLAKETINAAALARDLTESQLRRWLRDAGVIPAAVPRGESRRRYLMVRTVDIDNVVAARREKVA